MAGRSALLLLFVVPLILANDEEDAEKFLKDNEYRLSKMCNELNVAMWEHETDLENKTLEEQFNKKQSELAKLQMEFVEEMSEFKYNSFTSGSLYRQFRFFKDKGIANLDQKLMEKVLNISTNLTNIYSTSFICKYEERHSKDCTKWYLNPDLEEVLAKERDWDKLRYVWEQWREVTGKRMRDLFIEKNRLLNRAAIKDGYANEGERWLYKYTVDAKEVELFSSSKLSVIDSKVFRELAEKVYKQILESLYKKLHAYVRMKLIKVYGDRIDPKGPLQAHILGNMWGQEWENIMDIVVPFANQPTFDVTDDMKKKDWTIKETLIEAENFFKSIELFNMTDTFWEKSVMNETSWGKKIVCHASASDFCMGSGSEDFRIKMCASIGMEDLLTVHHEMGHIEYYMAYRDQPFIFREGANPGFHEAIGDMIGLSVSTPSHFENVIGLSISNPSTSDAGRNDYKEYTCDQQRDLNALMIMALTKVAFLPFGYLVDRYRWAVFDGTVKESDLNHYWWKLREEIQGIVPPGGKRGEEYFDAGAKHHIAEYVPYMRYFVSFIMQFQFHRNLCSLAGYKGPLHRCDIYNSVKAGKVLRDSLAKGFSEPWPLVAEKLAGSPKMDASAIEEYFQPLIDFLDKELEGQHIGWDSDNGANSLYGGWSNICFAVLPLLLFYL